MFSSRENAEPSTITRNFDEHRPTVGHFELMPGAVTICRFDCASDKYQLLTAQGKVIDGPATSGTYGWTEFKDWPKIEHKIVCGLYIHHCAGVHEKVAPALYEACKYIPGLCADPAEPTAEEIESYLR